MNYTIILYSRTGELGLLNTGYGVLMISNWFVFLWPYKERKTFVHVACYVSEVEVQIMGDIVPTVKLLKNGPFSKQKDYYV